MAVTRLGGNMHFSRGWMVLAAFCVAACARNDGYGGFAVSWSGDFGQCRGATELSERLEPNGNGVVLWHQELEDRDEGLRFRILQKPLRFKGRIKHLSVRWSDDYFAHQERPTYCWAAGLEMIFRHSGLTAYTQGRFLDAKAKACGHRGDGRASLDDIVYLITAVLTPKGIWLSELQFPELAREEIRQLPQISENEKASPLGSGYVEPGSGVFGDFVPVRQIAGWLRTVDGKERRGGIFRVNSADNMYELLARDVPLLMSYETVAGPHAVVVIGGVFRPTGWVQSNGSFSTTGFREGADATELISLTVVDPQGIGATTELKPNEIFGHTHFILGVVP